MLCDLWFGMGVMHFGYCYEKTAWNIGNVGGSIWVDMYTLDTMLAYPAPQGYVPSQIYYFLQLPICGLIPEYCVMYLPF